MTPTVRFAPSPTGLLHVGNARTAALNWLFARQANGRFILRLDDTDPTRSRPEYAEAVERDLAWLSLIWDEKHKQSDRLDAYEAAAAKLKADGRLYPAYETPAELERRRKLARARGRPPVYDRAALRLSASERARLEAEGRRPHWRFRLEPGHVAFEDLIRGRVEIDMASLSDPVLIREDGAFLYTLASVADDIEMGVSHIVRGEDHVTNAAAQIQIFEALGAQAPAFAHHALLVGPDGGPLSKRAGAASVAEHREGGIESLALLSYLAKIGGADAIEHRSSVGELIDEFSFDKLGRAPARFDAVELGRLNGRYLHGVLFGVVKARLAGLGVAGPKAEPFWEAVRGNLTTLDQAREWWEVVAGEIAPEIAEADRELVARAAELLPDEPWDQDTWRRWANEVKVRSGRRGKALFLPLRKALTGQGEGPELKLLLPLMGRERALARLRG